MSRLSSQARNLDEPGPECLCGAELRRVPLPTDLAELSGRESIWTHVETGDTRCYPDVPGEKCMAEPDSERWPDAGPVSDAA